jgi:hypothetical protein
MSVPPEESSTSTGTTGMGTTRSGMPAMPSMPFPMNPEFIVYLLVWAVVALCWIISDRVVVNEFLVYTVALTVGYLLSRGIAKASRVYE